MLKYTTGWKVNGNLDKVRRVTVFLQSGGGPAQQERVNLVRSGRKQR